MAVYYSLLALVLLLGFFVSRKSRGLKYSPGPKALPLLGAIKEHPKTEFWKKYAEWGRQYGKIALDCLSLRLAHFMAVAGNLGLISFHILGCRLVVLNSAAVADNLLAEEGMRVGSLAGALGKWLVDSLPALKCLPEWFPFAGFKKQAKAWSHQLYTQSLEPHDWVKGQIANGKNRPSLTSTWLESKDPKVTEAEHDDIVLWTAGAMYAAGADTTVAVVKAFFFLMLLHPDQKRAQAEVDSVISKERRLPLLSDRSAMPYLDAILQEVLRWAPPVPMGLFHSTSTDDEYNGLFVAAKTTVIANIRAMTHDADQYPDPFVFNPDRFLVTQNGPTQKDPRQLVFGFGRRICPGQHLAEASMFIQMATALATLEISKGVDSKGQVIEPEIAFTTSIVSHVKPFQYSIKPRSSDAVDLLLQTQSVDL